jgi:uncharacterized protein YifE (UPF0438 family)
MKDHRSKAMKNLEVKSERNVSSEEQHFSAFMCGERSFTKPEKLSMPRPREDFTYIENKG